MCHVGCFLGRISKYKHGAALTCFAQTYLEVFTQEELDSDFPRPESWLVYILFTGPFLFFYILTSLTKVVCNLSLKCPVILDLPVT